MEFFTFNRNGSTMVQALTLATIGIGGLTFVSNGMAVRYSIVEKQYSRFIAEQFASELVEYFTSLSASEFALRFSNERFLLCDHINFQAHNEGDGYHILNPDAIAELPSLTLQQANRHYLVQIVDAASLIINQSACGRRIETGACIETAEVYCMQETERFLISVGVNWRSPKGAEEKVVLTSMLAGTLPIFP